MPSFTVLSPLSHDGRHYPIGETVILDDRDAAVLIADRVVASPTVAEVLLADTLRGSDYLPVLIRLTKDLTIKTAEVVERAFEASGLDRAGWNGLADDDRELRVASAVELIRRQHVDPRLEEATGGVGHLMAAAEGRRVAEDNMVEDPSVRRAETIVVTEAGATDATATIGTTLTEGGEASATIVVDPVAAVMPDAPANKSRNRS